MHTGIWVYGSQKPLGTMQSPSESNLPTGHILSLCSSDIGKQIGLNFAGIC